MKYVMCIDNREYPLDLTLHKVYRVVSNEVEERHGRIRVIDNTGEDYLYPARYFVTIELSEVAEKAFNLQAA